MNQDSPGSLPRKHSRDQGESAGWSSHGPGHYHTSAGNTAAGASYWTAPRTASGDSAAFMPGHPAHLPRPHRHDASGSMTSGLPVCSAAHGSGSHRGHGSGTGALHHEHQPQALAFTDAWMTMDPRVVTTDAPDEKGRLQNALDNLYATGELFLGRFVILSAAHRRFGGQGVVQV